MRKKGRKQGREPTASELNDWAIFCGDARRIDPETDRKKQPEDARAVKSTKPAVPPLQPTNTTVTSDGRRTLTAAEQEDWAAYTTYRQLPERKEEPPPKVVGSTRQPATTPKKDIPQFEIGSRAREVSKTRYFSSTTDTIVSEGTVDKKFKEKLRKGKLTPEATLDLHGMTRATAENEVARFVNVSFVARRRLLLIITGKGKQADSSYLVDPGIGVLQRMVPALLRSPQMVGRILYFEQAHSTHGGSGALYVYLRRNRSRRLR